MSSEKPRFSVPLEWHDRREGCWHGTRNGKVIMTILSQPDGKYQWLLRSVHTFSMTKATGRQDTLEDAKRSAQAAWDTWCMGLQLAAA